MSTFDGFVHEYPDIRVDFFRSLGRPPALAYFLSHVHSDHLAGLESFQSPFIYCSAATKEILLRLEKYPVRLNFANGILEDPRKQTYRHLAKVLKPIPMETPTVLELRPGHSIQVTLLDANHCAGAVMFLFEGDGKAVMYTGDIRAEPWFVNAVARNPCTVEYASGLKTLDCIYLDTSSLDTYPLQSKAEGLRELLEKVVRYPDDTIFCFQAWTYGYEEAWVALSKALKSKIHVDKYKMGIYKSLVIKSTDNRFAAQTHLIKEAPYLVGFTCGNNQHEGCLTLDESARIHSCEKGMGCSVMLNKPIVWIQPIVAHLKSGQDVIEVGIGGGGDDLLQKSSVAPEVIEFLIETISNMDTVPRDFNDPLIRVLKKAQTGVRDINLDFESEGLTGKSMVMEMIRTIEAKVKAMENPVEAPDPDSQEKPNAPLPNRIRFPYARHSTLPELRHFVQMFEPKDIWPCTVDPPHWIQDGITIRDLFGDCCSGDVFKHHLKMEEMATRLRSLGQMEEERDDMDSQQTTTSYPLDPSSPVLRVRDGNSPRAIDIPNMGTRRGKQRDIHASLEFDSPSSSPLKAVDGGQSPSSPLHAPDHGSTWGVSSPQTHKRDFAAFSSDPTDHKKNTASIDDESGEEESIDLQGDSQASAISDRTYATRLRAYKTVRANARGEEGWGTIGLISTTDHHTLAEEELGGR